MAYDIKRFSFGERFFVAKDGLKEIFNIRLLLFFFRICRIG